MKGQRSAIRILALLGTGLAGFASGQSITEFPVPTAGSTPFGITAGPDAALWFTEGQGNKIGRSTIAGSITEFPITTAGSVPAGITLGPDGNLWFTEFTGNQIGRINTAGVITEFPIPTAASQPSGIAAGPDGNLWFTEQAGNQIGRITPAGVITEFPIDTANSQPSAIAAGPDGNLWFTERMGNQIGRITPAGVITEFPVLTAGSGPRGITLGPDGNLWFTQQIVNKIGRITPAGVVTEFPIPTASSQPIGIAAGADGNLWFVEAVGNKVGRITPAGAVTEFPIPTADSIPVNITPGPDTNVWFTEQVGNQIGRMTTGPATPIALEVDEHAMIGSVSNTNGVFEPDETVEVSPSWRSNLIIVAPLTGTASNFTGPAATYVIADATADYGSPDPGETVSCEVTEDCYLLGVSGTRVLTHWDATFDETLSGPSVSPRSWTLHIGASFADVPTSNIFYAFIENLFHNGVTGGCAFGYCPTNPVTRAQMAVFLLKAKFGSAHVPPPCTGTVFTDVPCTTSPFDPWIEELASLSITGGCGGGNYCPGSTVTRKQMAVFLLKTLEGSTYNPPDCTIPVFADVPCTPGTGFSDWIEELYARGITGGCSASPLNYCPDNPNNRGQMAVFLVKTFGLLLYGPY